MVAPGERRNDAGVEGANAMTRLLLIGLIGALAACDSGPTVEEKNASVADVAEAVADARSELKFMPGRWESNVTLLSMEAPGMPAGVAEAMKGTLGKAQRSATCLTKEQAEKPAADFFAKDAKDCTYDHFTMGGGKIDAKMKCGRDGHAIAMAMTGAYDSDSYDMTMNTTVNSGGAGPMTMKMKVASSHAGACRGNEDATS